MKSGPTENAGEPSAAESPRGEGMEPKAAEPLPTRPKMPQFAGSVLLAEDDDVSGPLAKLILERLGLHVDLVTDGGQALEAASAGQYDLILMDCLMPVAGGIEVTRRIRASPAMACWRTPIVALTGNATRADAAECLEAGMDDFMGKPILFQAMIAMLEKHLPALPHAGGESRGSGAIH